MGVDKESHFASSKLEPGVTMVSQGLFSVMNVKMIRVQSSTHCCTGTKKELSRNHFPEPALFLR